jgi:ribosomal protein L11 methyltransferase
MKRRFVEAPAAPASMAAIGVQSTMSGILSEPGATLALVTETDPRSARRIADALAESPFADKLAVSFAEAGARWRVAIHLTAGADATAIRVAVAAAAGRGTAQALRVEALAERDWIAESLAGLAPVAAGRFIVHGAHDRARAPANGIGIEIEAALAFGTGHHGTTRGCLLALDRLGKFLGKRRPPLPSHWKRKGKASRSQLSSPLPARRRVKRLIRAERRSRILDVGTGSGVLAIAAARAMHQPVLATDIDPIAVRTARGNVALNRAGSRVRVVHAGGVTAPPVRQRAPFDLVFANILLGPLQRMAVPLRRLAAPGARIVVSGLLAAQVNAALAAYRPLALERRIDIDGWTTLVLRRECRKS